MKEIKKKLDIWKMKETSWWQGSRDRFFLGGDRNNDYFNSLANQRHMKNHLSTRVGVTRSCFLYE